MQPWIAFIPEVVDVAGDLEFIRDQVKAGNWLKVHGAINAIGNKITIIPASGKTLFMFRGKMTITGHPAVGGTGDPANLHNQVKSAFKVDGAIEDTADGGHASWYNSNAAGEMGGGIGMNSICPLDVLGSSLIGDGIKEVAIENVDDDGNADATMSGWIENT